MTPLEIATLSLLLSALSAVLGFSLGFACGHEEGCRDAAQARDAMLDAASWVTPGDEEIARIRRARLRYDLEVDRREEV